MRTLLEQRYGFANDQILVLADGEATRRGILEAIRDHLLKTAQEGDHALFYFSGHGSQRVNSKSAEEDKLDETLVPADSLLGVDDIRDKELARLFNQVLDRGAELTVILDSCHSGSGVRGLTKELPVRRVHIDRRDVKDGGTNSNLDMAPELRGALVLSATDDKGTAQDSWDEEGKPGGAFTLAFLKTLGAVSSGEAAEDIFQRVRARLHASRPAQIPVIAGSPAVKRAPLFGVEAGKGRLGPPIAVEKVGRDGRAQVAGGRIHGLTVGSILGLREQEESACPHQPPQKQRLRLKVTELLGLNHARVRPMEKGQKKINPGDLLEVLQWSAPPGDSFRVWIPAAAGPDTQATAAELSSALKEHLVADPTEKAPTHTLRWAEGSWHLRGPQGSQALGAAPSSQAVLAELAKSKAPRVFLQIPAPGKLASLLEIGQGRRFALVERAEDPRRADFVLVGRRGRKGDEFAWVRPDLATSGELQTSLPSRSDWFPHDQSLRELADRLSSSASRLAIVYRWLTLDSPSEGDGYPYRLTVRADSSPVSGAGSGAVSGTESSPITDGASISPGRWFDLLLTAEEPPPWAGLRPRHVYVFVLDSRGEGTLLFPNENFGGVENLLPVDPEMRRNELTAAREIVLRPPSPSFCTRAPYGVDTFFLLTTREALPDPSVLSFKGVRAVSEPPQSPLEALLFEMGSSRRGNSVSIATTWSLERLTLRSLPPKVENLGGASLCSSSSGSPSGR